ncbi:membrane dipeptidase-domain-containing protein [Corynascus novoguineensis]|uniref:Dipeptidase n=1 Tax=Corynascus novoguineensis TaxID=1126955 RepID=A0AAN7D1R9_9PEZI|nr:membrane dipeptidase-domain-containing protein [Corynascus novoguineensis]
MKTDTELPGPVARTGLKTTHSSLHSRPIRRFWVAKASLYVVLPLILFALFIQLPVHSTCFGHKLPFSKPRTIEERVKRILRHHPLIDGHNDLAIWVRAYHNNHIYDETFSKPFVEGGLSGHVDIPRLRAGMNGGAFWSAFWPCPANGTDYSDENYHRTVQETLNQIDLLTRLRQAHPDVFSPPTLTSHEAVRRFRHSHGGRPRLVSPLAIEGLHQIGNSVGVLRQLHALGVRYATLTHNCGNRFADAALWEQPTLRRAPPVWGGVSPAGRAIVHEMNRLGVIIDLAHTSVDTMRDVLGAGDGWEGSRAPVVFSHSSAYALCPHPRNVPDDVLDLVGKKNGVVMVNFNPEFISCVEAPDRDDGLPDYYPQNATLQQVLRHVLHIGRRIGFDHVGLGSDFDGITEVPEGLEDVSKFPDLVAELLRQGVSDKDAAKIVGGNVLRVWRDVEVVAEKMQKAGEPVLEDDLSRLLTVFEGAERAL